MLLLIDCLDRCVILYLCRFRLLFFVRTCVCCFFFQAEDGIRDLVRSRGLGDVYKRQLQEWGFDSETLTNWQRDVTALGNLLASEEADSADAEPQIDRAAELQEKWQVKPGDVWRIGVHKMAGGDCREPGTWGRLLVLSFIHI